MSRLILIGCSKAKEYKPESRRGGRVFPRELYSSQLFRARVEYAESIKCEWAVLSARFGLWHSSRELVPCNIGGSGRVYDTTFDDLNRAERAEWHTSVAHKVVEQLFEPFEVGTSRQPLNPNQLTVEIHAGRSYCQPLAEILKLTGINVQLPCEGLGIGQQLQLYSRRKSIAEVAQ